MKTGTIILLAAAGIGGYLYLQNRREQRIMSDIFGPDDSQSEEEQCVASGRQWIQPQCFTTPCPGLCWDPTAIVPIF